MFDAGLGAATRFALTRLRYRGAPHKPVREAGMVIWHGGFFEFAASHHGARGLHCSILGAA